MSQPVPLTNLETTLRQCATISSIVGELFDRLPSERSGVAGGESGGCTDKNANDSICTSLILACNRLDDILKDDKRWALPSDTHDTLHTHAKMECEILKSRVLSENLQRTVAKASLFGAVTDRLSGTDIPAAPRTLDEALIPPAPTPLEKKQRKRKK